MDLEKRKHAENGREGGGRGKSKGGNIFVEWLKHPMENP